MQKILSKVDAYKNVKLNTKYEKVASSKKLKMLSSKDASRKQNSQRK